jgi:hypothetical protein
MYNNMAKKVNKTIIVQETEKEQVQDVVSETSLQDLSILELQALMNQTASEATTETDLAFLFEIKKIRNEKLAEVAN